ncbi:MAG: rane protein [Phycisphaerales bacterium]|nr:rane protein [Phycisphaerales bacterium]
MRDADELFAALAKSTFRRRFRLSAKELAYARGKGFDVILQHARDFVRDRVAPAVIANDGKQTPMRNHPVFVAQHATATCCRGCLAKWHQLPAGRELSAAEQAYVVGVIERWLRDQGAAEDAQGRLFP